MKVYAFIGKAGTGKSHHSMLVAKENKIDYIIDDGLLMTYNRIVAGKSAKGESTTMASVRCAIFADAKHAETVKRAIKKEDVKSILVIGTSEKMVNKIVNALDLPPVEKTILIEDVSTPEKMATAKRIRMEQGKHVIPAPAFEVKKQFSGYFMDSMNMIFNRKGKTYVAEKTVIRPTFSYRGEYKISGRVISDISVHTAKTVENIAKIIKVKVNDHKCGSISINIDISVRIPSVIIDVGYETAAKVKTAVELMTALNVKKVNINIKALERQETSSRKQKVKDKAKL